jgi:leucyl/phenylalanyl-tRNA--protein transferase
MAEAFIRLHRLGIAHSVEAWKDGHLVGGLYGVQIGAVFFGESMFTRVSDASKTAFAVFADAFFNRMGGALIDSQVYTDHIARFGGMNISRSAYVRKIRDFFGNTDASSLLRPGLWVNF